MEAEVAEQVTHKATMLIGSVSGGETASHAASHLKSAAKADRQGDAPTVDKCLDFDFATMELEAILVVLDPTDPTAASIETITIVPFKKRYVEESALSDSVCKLTGGSISPS